MHKILVEIKEIINENINRHLPDVLPGQLEENGSIYYMNGRNGTEFDWHVNGHISDFMVFYNDKTNLGAVKLSLFCDGRVQIYIYKDKGNTLIHKEETAIKDTEYEILSLAVILKKEADDKKLFDKSMDLINSDINITDRDIAIFTDSRKYYEKIIKRMNLLNSSAIVSARILKDGYKVGYMLRDEPRDESDSGWQIMSGDEDDKYINDINNLSLVPLGYLCNLDPDIVKYIDSPAGTRLIRISSKEFEEDKYNKKIFVEKRNGY